MLGVAVSALALAVAGACRPADILDVPAPAGVISGQQLQNQAGAENAFADARAQLFAAADGTTVRGSLCGADC